MLSHRCLHVSPTFTSNVYLSLLQTLYVSLSVSVRAFANIGGLIFIFLFIYAYVGVLMFGTIQLGWGLNGHASFKVWHQMTFAS